MSDEELAAMLARMFTGQTTFRMLEDGKTRSATACAVEAETYYLAWLHWLRCPEEGSHEL